MQVLDRASVDKEDLRHMTDLQMTRMGIKVLDRRDTLLQCMTCAVTWRPALDASGHLPADFWVCPSRCNQS